MVKGPAAALHSSFLSSRSLFAPFAVLLFRAAGLAGEAGVYASRALCAVFLPPRPSLHPLWPSALQRRGAIDAPSGFLPS